MRMLLAVLGSFLSAYVFASVPEPPRPLCIDAICPAEPSGGVKWHPGHYMLVYRGDSHEVVMSRRIPEICAESALKGLQFRAQWYDLERVKGTYDFSRIDDMYQALAACGKRLVVEVWAVDFGTTSAFGIVPDYLIMDSAYDGGVAKTSTGYIAKLWEASVMDRLISLYSALAVSFDGRPFFEGIIFTETATGGVQDSYSAAAFIEQLKRALPVIVAAWPQTNVFVFNNFIQGSTDNQFIDFYSFLRDSRVGTGGPDVAPPGDSKSERIYRGELGRTDLRGHIPAGFAVQTPALGGKTGTFTANELYQHCVGQNRCSHMFWIRNTESGGAAQQWSTGLLPFIRQNPKTAESCPTTYKVCNRQ